MMDCSGVDRPTYPTDTHSTLNQPKTSMRDSLLPGQKCVSRGLKVVTESWRIAQDCLEQEKRANSVLVPCVQVNRWPEQRAQLASASTRCALRSPSLAPPLSSSLAPRLSSSPLPRSLLHLLFRSRTLHVPSRSLSLPPSLHPPCASQTQHVRQHIACFGELALNTQVGSA